MPSSAAALGDSAMARKARPSCVLRMTIMSTAINANESTMIATSSTLIWMPPNCSCLSGTMSDGKRRFSAPNTPCTALLKKMAMPMVAIIGIRCGAWRFAQRAQHEHVDGQAEQAAGQQRRQQRDPERRGQMRDHRQRGIGADHEHRAVRQVDDAEHAEDEREAEREERVDAAERQRVDELLFEHRLRCL